MSVFIERLTALSKKKGTTRKELCHYLGIGINQIKRWETNGTIPNPCILTAIASYFGVSVDYLLGKETNPRSELIFLPDSNGYMIPLFESVSAGFGAYPDDNIIGYELCYIESKEEAAETICIKVSGDSMYPKIENGDVIQVHKQDSVDSGKIAVVLVDGEDALVKKVVYGSTWIELHSFNPMYPVMRFDGEDVLRVRVLGQVRTIIKRV